MSTPTSYRIPVVSVRMVRESTLLVPRKEVLTSDDAAAIARDFIGAPDREHLIAIFVDAGGRPIGIHRASVGGTSHCIVDAPSILRAAILACARAIVLAHNHPSGDATPSAQDVAATRAFADAANAVGIPLLDHITLGEVSHRSVAWQ